MIDCQKIFAANSKIDETLHQLFDTVESMNDLAVNTSGAKINAHSDFVISLTSKQRFFGIEMGTRMSVIDYSGKGDLLVLSPVAPSPTIVKVIKQRGSVRALVAPNLFHHLYVNSFSQAFPMAKKYGAPGMERKRPDLSLESEIEESTSYPWSASVDHCVVQGMPKLNEVVFFHKASKILFVTDLGFHFGGDAHWTSKLFFGVLGIYQKYGWANVEKRVFINQKSLFRQSILRILEWDFKTIVLCHGNPVENNAKKAFRRAFLV